MKQITSIFLILFLTSLCSVTMRSQERESRPDYHRPFLELQGGGVAYIHAMSDESEWAGSSETGSLAERSTDNPLFLIRLSETAGVNAEVSIAANPADPQHLVAAWMRLNSVARTRGLSTAYSTDGGATWRESELNATGAFAQYDENDPVVVAAAGNVFHVEFLGILGGLEASAILVATSTDGGRTFTEQSVVVRDSSGSPFSGIVNDKNWMTIDGTNSPHHGSLYSAWLRVNQTNGAQGIAFSRREKDSSSWTMPVLMNDTTQFPAAGSMTMLQGASVAVGTQGEVYAAWKQMTIRLPSMVTTGYLMFDKSTDGGRTFGKDRLIDSHIEIMERFNPNSLYARMHGFPQIAVDQSNGVYRGRVYICYAALDHGDADVFVVSSDDQGETWSSPVRIHNDALSNGAWQFFGQVAVSPAGVIGVSYYGTRPGTSLVDTYIAFSWDGGKSYLNRRISEDPFTPATDEFIGDYVGNVALENYAFPAWAHRASASDVNVFGMIEGITVSAGNVSPETNGLLIHGIHPNPVSSIGGGDQRVYLSLSVGVDRRIMISIFDVYGRLVIDPFDARFAKGTYTIPFDTSRLAGGTYLAILESAGKRVARKFLILE